MLIAFGRTIGILNILLRACCIWLNIILSLVLLQQLVIVIEEICKIVLLDHIYLVLKINCSFHGSHTAPVSLAQIIAPHITHFVIVKILIGSYVAVVFQNISEDLRSQYGQGINVRLLVPVTKFIVCRDLLLLFAEFTLGDVNILHIFEYFFTKFRIIIQTKAAGSLGQSHGIACPNGSIVLANSLYSRCPIVVVIKLGDEWHSLWRLGQQCPLR